MKVTVSKSILAYDQLRKAEYPPMGEQLDMLWHAMDEGMFPMVHSWYTAIKAVKVKYPKPAGNSEQP